MAWGMSMASWGHVHGMASWGHDKRPGSLSARTTRSDSRARDAQSVPWQVGGGRLVGGHAAKQYMRDGATLCRCIASMQQFLTATGRVARLAYQQVGWQDWHTSRWGGRVGIPAPVLGPADPWSRVT